MKQFVVIGGGILGASTAYSLAKRGANVTIIDRKDTGQATDAAAGIVCPWLSQRRNKAWYFLARNGARYYPALISELEDEGETHTGYKKVGSLSLHTDPQKLAAMQQRALDRKEEAPEMGDIRVLSSQETKERFPLLEDSYGSVFVSGAARVDGRSLRNALLRSAQKHGALLTEDEAILSVKENRIIGAETKKSGYISSDEMIVCAGAWANEFLAPLGIPSTISWQKAQIMHFEVPDEETGAWPVVMPPSDQYLLAFDSGKVVAGATHENTDEFDTRITADGLQEVLQKALLTAPGLANASFVEARMGFRPFTPGFLPMMGRLQGWEGIIAANGLGASGLTMGPYIGSELAKFALEMDTEIPFEQYSFEADRS
ncbi:NAD(P)/FAD-dependent oxidoreductase [Peribacillus kribbensis]|uniref:NAD(P)/FAD-dependent oxidoreductase n=1 Tax=Peribacillus kribbensis TaxID=356658 RepID=UPI0003F79929|nr:FAD-dependent oxidoreductase [Peribacillus kribbensis]